MHTCSLQCQQCWQRRYCASPCGVPPRLPDLALAAHDPAYVSAFLNGTISEDAMRKIGLPWSPQLVQRTLVGTGSAVLAARLALQYGVACMTNGGTHHAHFAHGSGVYHCPASAALYQHCRQAYCGVMLQNRNVQ